MGKSAILKKIHNAAKNYQRYLAGKTFMYVYEGKSIEVVFKNSSFLHLTGVNTKLKAKEFYKHAKTKNGLKVQEFFFDKNHPYDLAEKKTDYLTDLYRITNMEVLITENEAINESMNEALKIILAAIYFLQINNSSNRRWRSEADSVEEFADDSNAFLYFKYLTRV